jgi:hypothetical protein
LKSQYNTEHKQNVQMKTRIAQLEAELEKRDGVIGELQAVHGEPNYDQALQKAHIVSGLKQIIRDLRRDVASRDSEVKLLRQNIKSSQLNELQAEVEAYMKECVRLRHMLKTSDSPESRGTFNEQIHVQITNLSKANAELHADLEEARSEIEKWRDRVVELEKTPVQKGKSALEKETLKLRRRLNDMENKLRQSSATEADVLTLQASLDSSQIALQKSAQANSSLMTQLRAAEDKAAGLQSQLNGREAEAAESKAKSVVKTKFGAELVRQLKYPPSVRKIKLLVWLKLSQEGEEVVTKEKFRQAISELGFSGDDSKLERALTKVYGDRAAVFISELDELLPSSSDEETPLVKASPNIAGRGRKFVIAKKQDASREWMDKESPSLRSANQSSKDITPSLKVPSPIAPSSKADSSKASSPKTLHPKASSSKSSSSKYSSSKSPSLKSQSSKSQSPKSQSSKSSSSNPSNSPSSQSSKEFLVSTLKFDSKIDLSKKSSTKLLGQDLALESRSGLSSQKLINTSSKRLLEQLQDVADAPIASQDERVIAKYLSTLSKHSSSDDEALNSSSESSDIEYMLSYRTPQKAEYKGKGSSASEEDEFSSKAHGLIQAALSSSSSEARRSQGLSKFEEQPSDLSSNAGEDLPPIRQSVHSRSKKSSSSQSSSSQETSKSPKSHTSSRGVLSSTNDQPYDPSKALSRDPSKALSKDSSKVLSRNASKDPSKSLSRDASQILSLDSSKELSKDSSKILSKDSSREEVKAALEMKPDSSRKTLEPKALIHSPSKPLSESSKISQASSRHSAPLASVPSASKQALPVHPEELKDDLQPHFVGSLSKPSLISEGHSKESSSKSNKSKSITDSSKSIESRARNDSYGDFDQHSAIDLRRDSVTSKTAGIPKDSSESAKSKRSHHAPARPDEEVEADEAAIENGLQSSQTSQHNGLEASSKPSLRSLHSQSSKRSLAPSALEDLASSALEALASSSLSNHQPLQHSDKSLNHSKSDSSSHSSPEADKSPSLSSRSLQEALSRKLLSAQSSNLGEVCGEGAEVSALRDEVLQTLVEEVNAVSHRSSKQSMKSRKSSSDSSNSSSPSSPHMSSKSSSKSSSSPHSRAELLPDENEEQKAEVALSYKEEYPAIHEQAKVAQSPGGLAKSEEEDSSAAPPAMPSAVIEALQNRILGEREEAKEEGMKTDLMASLDSSKSSNQAKSMSRTSSNERVQAPLPDFVHVIRLETEQNLNEPIEVKSSEQYALLNEVPIPKVGTDEPAVLSKSSSSSRDSSKSLEEAKENSGLAGEPTPGLYEVNQTSLPPQDVRTNSESSSDSDEEAVLRKIMKYERQVKQLQDESFRQALQSDEEAEASLMEARSPSPWREQTLQAELNEEQPSSLGDLEEHKHDLKDPPPLTHSLSRHKSSHSGRSSSSSSRSSKKHSNDESDSSDKKASSSMSSSSFSGVSLNEGDEL